MSDIKIIPAHMPKRKSPYGILRIIVIALLLSFCWFLTGCAPHTEWDKLGYHSPQKISGML